MNEELTDEQKGALTIAVFAALERLLREDRWFVDFMSRQPELLPILSSINPHLQPCSKS